MIEVLNLKIQNQKNQKIIQTKTKILKNKSKIE